MTQLTISATPYTHPETLDEDIDKLLIPLPDDKLDIYDSILADMKDLNSIFTDLRGLVDEQQDPLDRTQAFVEQSLSGITEAEEDVNSGAASYSRNTVAVYIIAGTILSMGFGGAGMLFGIKPLAGIVLGGLLLTVASTPFRSKVGTGP